MEACDRCGRLDPPYAAPLDDGEHALLCDACHEAWAQSLQEQARYMPPGMRRIQARIRYAEAVEGKTDMQRYLEDQELRRTLEEEIRPSLEKMQRRFGDK